MAENLTTQQSRAIAALLTNRTIGEAARAAKVGERTLTRWLSEDELFRLRLAAAETDQIDQATRQLVALQSSAIETVADIMGDDHAPALARIRAAQLILDTMIRLRELRNVEARLQALEELFNGQGNNTKAAG